VRPASFEIAAEFPDVGMDASTPLGPKNRCDHERGTCVHPAVCMGFNWHDLRGAISATEKYEFLGDYTSHML
jgi:hypothetical protein